MKEFDDYGTDCQESVHPSCLIRLPRCRVVSRELDAFVVIEVALDDSRKQHLY